MIDAISINDRCKSLREESGYTQQNIADFLNVDQSFICKVEKGDRFYTADMIDKLASLYGISVSSILEDNAIKTTCAFRTSELSSEDMNVIATINKIALNANYMSKLLGEDNED